MQLPSLRERSHEASDDTAYQHNPIDSHELTGKGPAHIVYLSRCKPTIKPLVPDENKAEPPYKGQCRSPGTGDLTLDLIPGLKDSTRKCSRPVRSSSSNYSETPSLEDDDSEVPTIQPPPSPPHTNSLHLCDLDKYSRANDRLSNLRSSSDSSGGKSVHGAAEEAAMAAQGWQTVLKSSQGRQNTSAAQYQEVAPKGGTKNDAPTCNEQDVETNLPERVQNSHPASHWTMSRDLPRPNSSIRNHHLPIFSQYDGAYDVSQQDDFGATNATTRRTTDPSEETEQHTAHASTKRRASHFSLRSLSSSLVTKRPRLSLRKFATTVRREFAYVRQKLRLRTAADRRRFEA